MHHLAWLYWNPPREAFTIPFIDRPVVWYGILFVTGLILGYFVIVSILTKYLSETKLDQQTLKAFPDGDLSKISYFLADRLCWFVVLGTVIGARLGEVIFYDWSMIKDDPLTIFQIWKGGLSSHGGVIGVMSGFYLYSLYIRRWVHSLSFIRILDFAAIPAALASCFIRLGNFMNQELIGTPTTMPWGIIFGNAADGSQPIPRHPVQLYEAAAYLAIFVLLFTLWKKKSDRPAGTYIGLLLTLVFTSRFILEFWKEAFEANFHIAFLQMGQLLSIPFILLGLFLLGSKQIYRRAAENAEETQREH